MQPGAADQGQPRPVVRAVAAPAHSVGPRSIVRVRDRRLLLVTDPEA